MTLKIENCNDVRFIIYLIKAIGWYLRSNIKINKLYYINKYLETLDVFSHVRIKITATLIIYMAINSLEYEKYSNGVYIITINRNKKIFGTNAKLYDMCRLINYGSMSINGYPIFTEAFNYIVNNIESLYNRYKWGF